MNKALRFCLGGPVQGRGLRPALARLALSLGLAGEVANVGGRVEGVVEGEAQMLEAFFAHLAQKYPDVGVQIEPGQVLGRTGFQILKARSGDRRMAALPLDLPPCPACLAELADPHSRRYRHPFIACAACGPRLSILADLPWAREKTSMAHFPLCAACEQEFHDPRDRRFHAEALSCPDCGPRLCWVDGERRVEGGEAALAAALARLRAGGIVALKGVGGYQLLCDARNAEAVARLRARKRRPGKPLAVMYPWLGADGLEAVRRDFFLHPAESAALVSEARPIVLLQRLPSPQPLSPRERGHPGVAYAGDEASSTLTPGPSPLKGEGRSEGVAPVERGGNKAPSPRGGEGWGEGDEGLAPGLDEIGVMLPSSPLHHLLLADFGGPLVATSGNRSGEPLVWDERDAEMRLASIADAFLHHDRPILRPVDDPVRRRIAGSVRPLRLGRGDAPLELELPVDLACPTLAVGGQMKNAIALGWGRRAVLSPHIGELESPRALERFTAMIEGLQALYGVRAERIVHDGHPGYAASRWAKAQGLPYLAVQHHAAHASALYAEAWQARGAGPGEMLVLVWDGLGLGAEGGLWGGEALLGRPGQWRRVASLRPFPLPGGERAAREPWRSAFGMAWAAGLEVADLAPPGVDVALLRGACAHGLSAPVTSSMGRLFDGAAALLGVRRVASFEGEAAMRLEALAATAPASSGIPLDWVAEDGRLQLDWTPLLSLLQDASLTVAERAMGLHQSLAQAAVSLACELGEARLGLAGGVMQNRLLVEAIHALAKARGMKVIFPAKLPVNDAGLALGQLIEAHFIEEKR